MPIQIEQKFPRCTLCGKMLPLKTTPISIGQHRLCSPRCAALLPRLRPHEVAQAASEQTERILSSANRADSADGRNC
jgi:hypothetical protein